jgi:transposase-like protein
MTEEINKHPWTRRPDTVAGRGESSQAYDSFRAYLFIPPKDRSVRAAAEQVNKADSLLRRWSRQWDWVNRAAAYDSYMVTAKVDGEADRHAEVENKRLDVASDLLDHLSASMKLWKPGYDPSLRWTTAFTAAAKVQHAALTLRDTTTKTDDEAIARILEIMGRKAEGESHPGRSRQAGPRRIGTTA